MRCSCSSLRLFDSVESHGLCFFSSLGTAAAAAVHWALWLGCCQKLLVLGVYVWLSLSLCCYPEPSPWLMQPKRFYTLGLTASHMSDICLWRWLPASRAAEQQLPGAVSLPETTGCVTVHGRSRLVCSVVLFMWVRNMAVGEKRLFDYLRVMKVFQQ